jgi:Zn-dependent protease with chaperone function
MSLIKNVKRLGIILHIVVFLCTFAILTGDLPQWLLGVNILILITVSFLVGFLAAVRSISSRVIRKAEAKADELTQENRREK